MGQSQRAVVEQIAMSHMKMTEAEYAAHIARNRALRGSRGAVDAPKPVAALLAAPKVYGAEMIEFTVPGPAVSKQRPRMSKNGHVYTPKKTIDAEKVIASVAKLAGCVPWAGMAVRIEADFYHPIPKSWPKGRKEDALLGTARPISGKDIDNQIKTLLDGMNEIAYADDAQVVELVCRKFFGLDPKTVVRIIPLP